MLILFFIALMQSGLGLYEFSLSASYVRINQSIDAVEFGIGWVVWVHRVEYTSNSSVSVLRTTAQGFAFNNTNLPFIVDKIVIQGNQLKSPSYILLRTIDGLAIRTLKLQNNITRSTRYPCQYGLVSVPQYSHSSSQLVYFAEKNYIDRFNLTIQTLTQPFKYPANQIILNILQAMGYLIINSYSDLDGSTGKLAVFNQTTYVQMYQRVYSMPNISQCNVTSFDDNNMVVIRVCPQYLEVWKIPDNTLFSLTISANQSSTNRFYNAIICNSFFIILTKKQLLFYTMSPWILNDAYNLSNFSNPPTSVDSQFKCLSNSKNGQFAFEATDQSGFKTIYYIDYSRKFIIDPTKPEDLKIVQEHFIQKVIEIVELPQFQKITWITACTSSLTTSLPILKQTLQPFSYLVQQTWFYGYHIVQYTEFIEKISKNSNFLNEIKINPKIIEFLSMKIYALTQKNNQYLSLNIFHERISEQIYMLYSIQDIYIYNFLQGIAFVFFIHFLSACIKKIKSKNFIIRIIREKLHLNSLWWNLAVALIESNLSNITYYALIQYNSSVYFTFSDKLNLVFTVFMHFIVFFYCYTFYRLVYRYSKQSKSRQLLNFGDYSHHGFWLQSIMSCHRRFYIAFIHSSFTQRHCLQLSLLIFFNIVNILCVFKLRKYFSSKFMMVLTFIYMICFLLIDIGLLIGTEMVYKQDLNSFRNNIFYNLFFIGLVLIMCIVVIMKIIFNFIFFFYFFCKKARKQNKINKMINLKSKNSKKTHKNKVPQVKNTQNQQKFKPNDKNHIVSKKNCDSQLKIKKTKKQLNCIQNQIHQDQICNQYGKRVYRINKIVTKNKIKEEQNLFSNKYNYSFKIMD